MIYLLSILKHLNPAQRKDFMSLFSDLDYELNELGWKGNETDLINDMLFNHFGLSIDDETQLKRLTDSVLKEGNLQAAMAVINSK